MSILTQCRQCGKKYRFPQSRAGRRVRCKECNSSIRIPQPQPVDEEFDDEELEFRRPATRRRRTSKQKPHRAIISLIIVGVAVVFVGIGIWAVRSLTGRNAPDNLAEITPDKWSVVVDTASERPPAPPGEPPHITFDDIDYIRFSRQNSRWCAVQYSTGKPSAPAFEFVDIHTGEKKSGTQEMSRWEKVVDISGDAKYAVGVTRRDSEHKERAVQVYSFENQRMMTFELGERQSFHTARLLSGNRLLIGKIKMVSQPGSPGMYMDTGAGTVTIHNLTPPISEHSFRTENGSHKAAALSRGGRYFVFASRWKLYVHDIESGEMVGSASLPRFPDGIGHVCRNLSFSHDGTRLAGTFGSLGASRVLCWDWSTGKGVGDFSNFPSYVSKTAINPQQNDDLAWLADDSAWIFQGHFIVDPETGNELGNYLLTKTNDERRKFYRISSGALAVVSQEPRRQPVELAVVPLDLSLINRSKQASHSDNNAYVSLHKKVSIDVEIEQIQHGTKEATRRVIADIARQKLTSLGFEIADNQPVTLKIIYTESKGDVLVQLKSTPGIFIEPDPSGKSVTSTRAAVGVMWQVDGVDNPVWQEGIEVDPSFIYLMGEISDAAAREASLRKASEQFARIVLPYFVPKDSSLVTLPNRVLLLPEEDK